MRYIVICIMTFFILSCTSKVKEGADIAIYNERSSDIFIIDKYSFENKTKDKIEIYGEGFSYFTGRIIPHLLFEYITRYTVKRIFFPIEDYENNRKYDSLVFYIIKNENLDKTKAEII